MKLTSILFFALMATCALAKQDEETVMHKLHEALPNLESLQEAFEKAKDTGSEGLDAFVDTLKEQRRKIDEYYHPQKKTWADTAKEQYEGLVDKIKEWQCRAEEKAHELRFGSSAGYACSTADSEPGMMEAAKNTAYQAAKDTLDSVKDKLPFHDLETAFNKAKDESTQGLQDVISSVKSQAQKLESLYNDVLAKANKMKDPKSKEWADKFKESAGDSLRRFRELGDEFEQRTQDFLGSDKSRWAWISKFKLW